MVRDVDVVVVGAGIVGSATARVLAQAGRGVLLIDQFPAGHSRGASHGGSRIFRLNYADERYVRMAQGALEGWRELEAECGERLIVPTGCLDIGIRALETARALSACGVRFDELSADEVEGRWQIAMDRDEPTLFQPDGGISLADRALEAFQAGARDAGAEIVTGERAGADARALLGARRARRTGRQRTGSRGYRRRVGP